METNTDIAHLRTRETDLYSLIAHSERNELDKKEVERINRLLEETRQECINAKIGQFALLPFEAITDIGRYPELPVHEEIEQY